MKTYTVIKNFSLPISCISIGIGETVAKVVSTATIIAGGMAISNNKALFDWVGSAGSQGFLEYVGEVPDPSPVSIYAGTGGKTSIPEGAEMLEVSLLDLGYTPDSIVTSVIKPDESSANIFATVREDDITSTGFSVDFSSPIPSSGYFLSYFIAPLVDQGAPRTEIFSEAIPSGVTGLTVVRDFGFEPEVVIAVVAKPDSESQDIWATVIRDTITENGFEVVLTGETMESGYVLNYLVKSGV